MDKLTVKSLSIFSGILVLLILSNFFIIVRALSILPCDTNHLKKENIIEDIMQNILYT